jgi:hypothetical protein
VLSVKHDEDHRVPAPRVDDRRPRPSTRACPVAPVPGRDLCFLTYFNVGLRVFDLRDPHHVAEIAYMIRKDPPSRIGPLPRTLVTQVEDVLVDARGVVYFIEKNTGLYVARWHGRP